MSASPVSFWRNAIRSKAALEAREAELLDVIGALQREQDQSATQSQAHESAVAELRTAFDQERLALMAAADVSAKEVDQQRRVFERERVGAFGRAETARRRSRRTPALPLTANVKNCSPGSSRARMPLLQLAPIPNANPQRSESRSKRSRSNGRSCDRASSGSASCASSPNDGTPIASSRSGLATARPFARTAGERNSPADDASAIVPKETLRQARAQFEFLAKECLRRGDVATQAMCELGAHTMQLALAADESADASPIGRMALSILSLSDPDSPAGGESERSAG